MANNVTNANLATSLATPLANEMVWLGEVTVLEKTRIRTSIVKLLTRLNSGLTTKAVAVNFTDGAQASDAWYSILMYFANNGTSKQATYNENIKIQRAAVTIDIVPSAITAKITSVGRVHGARATYTLREFFRTNAIDTFRFAKQHKIVFKGAQKAAITDDLGYMAFDTAKFINVALTDQEKGAADAAFIVLTTRAAAGKVSALRLTAATEFTQGVIGSAAGRQGF